MLRKLAFAALVLVVVALVALGLLSSGQGGPPAAFKPPVWTGPRTVRIAVSKRPACLPARALVRLPDTSGIKLDFVHIPDPGQRWQMLASGDIDIVITNLQDYALGAARFNPGVVLFPVGVSEGSDAIVTRSSGPPVMAYVPGTVGEFLAMSQGQELRPVAARDAGQAANWLQHGDAQAAALWEPWVSKALAGGARRLVSTSATKPSVAVWVASHQLLSGHSKPRADKADLAVLAQAWFDLATQLQAGSPLARRAVAQENGLSSAQLKAELKGFRFLTLSQAQQWEGSSASLTARLDQILQVWSLSGEPNTPRTDYSKAFDFDILDSLHAPQGLQGAVDAPDHQSTPAPRQTATAAAPAAVQGSDPGRTGVYHTTALRDERGVAWTVHLSSRDVQTCPAVAGDRLLVGCDDGRLYALSLKQKGHRLWSFVAGDSIESSPAVADGRVFFGCNDGHLYALALDDGSKLWSFPTDKAISSSPAVVGDTVYATSQDGSLYAVSAKTGKKIWSFDTGGAIYGSAAVDHGRIFVGSQSGKLYALDANDGSRVWVADAHAPLVASPVASSGVVYGVSRQGRAFALHESDGSLVWERQLNSPVLSNPILDRGILALGTKDGSVHALDASTGKQKWTSPGSSPITANPCAAQGVLYVSGQDGRIVALDVTTGQRLWVFSIQQGWVYAPLVHDGQVLFGTSTGFVYCLQ